MYRNVGRDRSEVGMCRVKDCNVLYILFLQHLQLCMLRRIIKISVRNYSKKIHKIADDKICNIDLCRRSVLLFIRQGVLILLE